MSDDIAVDELLRTDVALHCESAEDARRYPRPRQCYSQFEPVVEQYKGNQDPPSSLILVRQQPSDEIDPLKRC